MVVIALLTLSVTGSAQAQDGSSDVPAVNQYVETVPTGRGEVAPKGDRAGGDPLPKRVEDAIERQGGAQSEQLRAIAAPAAGAAAPQPSAARKDRAADRKRHSGTREAARERAARDQGSLGTAGTDVASATTKAIGGAGDGFVLLLAGMLLTTVALTGAALRGRRAPPR